MKKSTRTGKHLLSVPVLQRVKKTSQSLPPAGGKEIPIIFCRGAPQGGLSCPFGAIHLLYLTENTYQAVSVQFVRQGRTNCARGRLQSLCQKRAKPFLTVSSTGTGKHLLSVPVLFMALSFGYTSLEPAGTLSSSMTRWSLSPRSADSSMPQLSCPIIFRGARLVTATSVFPTSSSG